jgi:protein TonB
VDRDGSVARVEVRRTNPILDDLALAAVRQWRFLPALADSHPVAVWVTVPVRFTLHTR